MTDPASRDSVSLNGGAAPLTSEDSFRIMMDGIQDSAIFLLDPAGRVQTWNAGARRIHGYAETEIIGQPLTVFCPQEQQVLTSAMERLTAAAAKGRFDDEGWRLRQDGTSFWAKTVITPIYGSNKLAGFSVVVRDLTERRSAEEALRMSEARFEGIVRISEDAIISIDKAQVITMFNDGAEKTFGYTAAEIIGQRIEVLVPARFGAVHHRHVENFGGSPDSLRAMNERGAIFGRRKDGSEFPAEASISKFEVGGEKVLTVRLRDITARVHAEEAVKLSQARFEGIVRISEDAIISIDNNQNITMFNDGAEKIFGYSAKEIIGKRIEALVPDRFGSVHHRYVETFGSSPDALRAMNERGAIHGKRKDGSEFPAEASISKFEVGGEKVLTVRLRDITARMRAEEAVRLSQARFEGIVRISEDAIISIDNNQTITMFNDGAEKIFGYAATEIIGRRIEALVPDRFGSVHHKYVENFGASPDALRAMNERGAIYGKRKDGSEFPAEASISKFEVGGEKVLTVRLRDITERMKAEEAVRLSQARFEGIVRISEDAIISIDDDQKITMFNDGAEKTFGYALNEIMGQKIDKLIPSRFWKNHGQYVTNFAGSPDTLRPMNERGSLFGTRKDGTEFPVEASISKFEIGGERVLTVRLRDITDRKKAEEQIKSSLHEKEVLLKEIHHRVKNNLQVVSSLLSLQSGYPRVESVRDLFIESQNRVKSMALIHEKLYQSQDLANIDFSDYIESLAHHLFHSYTANPDLVSLGTDVDVSLDIDHAIPCGLIVNELLSNSLKHAFPDGRRGRIMLYFHPDGTDFKLRFSDDGIGLPTGLDFRHTDSLGLQLITTLTNQLNGVVEHRGITGTEFEIVFPAPHASKAAGDRI
jgi:PAS domain S-box-containing protein